MVLFGIVGTKLFVAAPGELFTVVPGSEDGGVVDSSDLVVVVVPVLDLAPVVAVTSSTMSKLAARPAVGSPLDVTTAVATPEPKMTTVANAPTRKRARPVATSTSE